MQISKLISFEIGKQFDLRNCEGDLSPSLNSVACGGGVCDRLGQKTPSALNIFENLGYWQFYCSLLVAPCLMENFQVKTRDISIKPKIWCIFHEKHGNFFRCDHGRISLNFVC